MLLARALAPKASVTWEEQPLGGPLDPRWYGDLGQLSPAGIMVTAQTAFNCGTVLAALRFLGNSVAMAQPKVFRELGGNRREEDRGHYLHRVLRRPNAWQNGYRWRQQQMIWLGLWGNSYNRILGGRSAFVDELQPLHPSRTRVLDQRPDGTIVYGYRDPKTGREEPLDHSEVVHFRGVGLDGISGDAVYRLMRNVVGIAIAAERHVSSFLRKGTRLSGVMSAPGTLTDEQEAKFIKGWNEAFGGSDNVGAVALVQGGMEFKAMSPDNQKAQLLELRDFQVGEILRVLGVPGVVVGYAEKTATYASADAFFEKGGIKHCVLPWVMNLEDEIDQALILEADPHYVKFNLDVLQRANLKDRYAAHYQACGGPWLSRNEIRTTEDRNPDPDPDMDKILTPTNLTVDLSGQDAGDEPPAAPPAPPRNPPAPPPPDPEEEALAVRAWRWATDAAARVVRREISAVVGVNGQLGAAGRFAKNPEGWEAWAHHYYERHAAHVAQAMHLPEASARAYAEAQLEQLLSAGPAVVETWEQDVVPRLAALAMES